jgi:hypothetical protein
MAGSNEKEYHCPHCGSPISPRRIGGGTNVWDVVRMAVIFGGVMGIIAVLRSMGH